MAAPEHALCDAIVMKRSRMTKKKKRSQKKVQKDTRKVFREWHAAPLKGSFMATAILGFLVSAYWVLPRSPNFGITFMVVFGMMFIASLISMTKGPIVDGRY